MTSDRELLKSCTIFETFDDAALDRFLECATHETCAAGELLFAEQTEGTKVYLIKQGEMSIQIALANASDTLAILNMGPGSILGEVSFMDEGPRSATATAASDCELLVWQSSDLRALAEQDYEIGYRLAMGIGKVLCERLRRWNVHILDNVSWGLE